MSIEKLIVSNLNADKELFKKAVFERKLVKKFESNFVKKRISTFSLTSGVFSGKYGLFLIDFCCKAQGFVSFEYCFYSPDLNVCKESISNENFNSSFGFNGAESLKLFDKYLKSFTFKGELHPSIFPDRYVAEIANLKNSYSNEYLDLRRENIAEPLLITSIKDYFNSSNIDC